MAASVSQNKRMTGAGNSPVHFTRVRATPLVSAYLDHELATLRHLVSRTRSAASRLLWRAATQKRTIRIATLVRLLPRIVPDRRISRSKVDGAWLVTIEHAAASIRVMSIQTRTPGRRVEDLTAPISVRIHSPDFVDLTLLEQLEATGLAKVEKMETP
jgi:hypothetical protein